MAAGLNGLVVGNGMHSTAHRSGMIMVGMPSCEGETSMTAAEKYQPSKNYGHGLSLRSSTLGVPLVSYF